MSSFTLIVLVFIVGGCVALTSPSASPSTSATASPSSAPATPTVMPPQVPTEVPSCAARTLTALTETQRIGQLFNIGLAKDQLDVATRAAVARYHFGSMWFTAKSSAGVAAIRVVADAVQAQASAAATGGVGFFVAANQEGGLVQALSGPGFDTIPSALSQGALTPAAMLQQEAARWGSQLAAAGINLNFAPVADVVPPGTDAQNAPIGQLKREYGHDPATVSSHVAAFIAGMQDAGIATSAKHFPGLGRVLGNTDFTAEVSDSVTTRDDPYLEPFATAVGSAVPFVMVALATYELIDPAHLAAFSPTVIGAMLRGDLGFAGVVISDDLGATAAAASIPPGTRAIEFIDAGGDMIIARDLASATAMATVLAAHVAEDITFRERVDDAALRVLDAKEAAGLVDCG